MSDPNAIASMLSLLDKSTRERLALDIVTQHEIGCTCPMCAAIRERFPTADASHPDRFEEQGGAHEPYPFDADNTVALKSVAASMLRTAESVARVAVAIESLRDVFRGRDDQNIAIKSPIRAIADYLIGGARQAPQTQRNPTPAQQALPIQQPAPTANPYAKQKTIATDEQMKHFKMDQKVRFDPRDWPGESHKGRMMLQCEPNFLEVYADQIEYFAGKAQEKVAAGNTDTRVQSDAKWGGLNAAQYRRLAQDMRNGLVQRAPVVPPEQVGPAATNWD